MVIPPPGRELLLQKLHACHPGMARMKTLARTCMFVWWPGLDSDIECFVTYALEVAIHSYRSHVFNTHGCTLQVAGGSFTSSSAYPRL